MGLETDADFATNHRFYTCQGGFTGGGHHDVRVMSLDPRRRAHVDHRPRGAAGRLPDHQRPARRLPVLVVGDRMYVGTGDAATGRNPENKKSFGGKTLCLMLSGRPCPDNPFVHSGNRAKRYVQTYGTATCRGIDRRRDGTLWSVEQGTYRDDEVNRLRNGGDYGYNPVPATTRASP